MAARQHLPQLDGVRAVAIAAVVAFHLGYLRGGWLGVDVFFVLSGYLITSLLVADGRPIGGVRRLLGAPGPSSPSRRAPLARGPVSVRLDRGSGPGTGPAPKPGPGHLVLRSQLAADHRRARLLRPVHRAEPPAAHLVAGHRGAVLPLLAVGARCLARGPLGAASVRPGTLWSAPRCSSPSLRWSGWGWPPICSGRTGPTWAPTPVPGSSCSAGRRPWSGHRGRQSDARRRAWSVATVVGVAVVAAGASTANGPPWWIWDGGLGVIALGSMLVIVGSVRAPDGPVARVLCLGPVQWLGLHLLQPLPVALAGHRAHDRRHDGADRDGSSSWPGWLPCWRRRAPASTWSSGHCAGHDWGALARRFRVPAVSMAMAGVLATTAVIVAGTVGPPEVTQATVSKSAVQKATGTVPIGHVDIPAASREDPFASGSSGTASWSTARPASPQHSSPPGRCQS